MSYYHALKSALAPSLRETPIARAASAISDGQSSLRAALFPDRLRAHRKGAGILLYHGVVPRVRDRFVEAAHIEADLFRRQIRFLKRRYRIVSLEEIVRRRMDGAAQDKSCVAITFDDGYRNNLDCALGILKDEGDLPMSVFIVTDFMGTKATIPTVMVKMLILETRNTTLEIPKSDGTWARRRLGSRRLRANAYWEAYGALRNWSNQQRQAAVDFIAGQLGDGEAEEIRSRYPSFDWLDWSDVQELHASGVVIGSHTRSHASLGENVDTERLIDEISGSRARIEREIGIPPWAFAYPYGGLSDISGDARNQIRDAGYLCALTTLPGTVTSDSNLFELPRLAGCVQSMGRFRLANTTGMDAEIVPPRAKSS